MEILKQGFRTEPIAQTMCSQKSLFNHSVIGFVGFSDAFGAVFLTFAVLETGLSIECFFKVNKGTLNSIAGLRHKEFYGKQVPLDRIKYLSYYFPVESLSSGLRA